MNRSDSPHDARPPAPLGDGTAVLLGCLGGVLGGIPLGGLIAVMVAPAWSLTSAIIVAHVTLAMVAMGAWAAPSLVSDPQQEADLAARVPADPAAPLDAPPESPG